MKVLKWAAAPAIVLAMAAQFNTASAVEIEVTVENLAPMNSITFAPLRIGFNNGSYDSFDNGATAGQPIISIAEGGSGADWFPAFGAADPTAVLGDGGLRSGWSVDPGSVGIGRFRRRCVDQSFLHVRLDGRAEQ